MTVRFAAAGTMLLALAGTASAQAGATEEPPKRAPTLASAPERPPPKPPHPDARSERVAVALSAGATAASWGLTIGAGFIGAGDPEASDRALQVRAGLMLTGMAGALIGPGLGHWYGGEGILTRGLALRAGGGAIALLGTAIAFDQCPLTSASESCTPTASLAIVAAGIALVAAGTIDDIVTAPRSARRHNRRLELAPVATHRSAGLALGGRF
jgi:hypothetical protein